MSRKLSIIAVTSGNKRFGWETYIYLNNLRENNISSKAHILVFVSHYQLQTGYDPIWDKIQLDFPEVGFHFYYDDPDFNKSLERLHKTFGYISLIRPALLSKFYKEFPQDVVFYTDTDITLTKQLNWDEYTEDDVCYLSNTEHYTGGEYFDSKVSLEFVHPDRWEEFKKRDILNEAASFCGITRDVVMANQKATGGAQHFLKGIDYTYWDDVLTSCIELKTHLGGVNQYFMRDDNGQNKENNGFQSWCADMWAVVWNLWKRGLKTATPPSLDFSWASDPIYRLSECSIFHNAGITSETDIRTTIKGEDGKNVWVNSPAFYKGAGRYCNDSITPFEDEEYIHSILNNPYSAEYCTHYYASEIDKVAVRYFNK